MSENFTKQGNSMTENDKPAVSFAEAVLLRPKMYTLGGTYEEVVAFLDGYFSGMAKANPYAPPVLQWVAFQQWLAVQLSVPSSDVFSTLKNELVRHRQFQNQAEARYAIAEYIERFYNCQRLHQALGYRSPEEFEKMAGES